MMTRLLLMTCLVGCSATRAPVEYSVSAQTNYERGLAELHRQDWDAASQYFSFIERLFPYSKYAPLAELRIADAKLGASQYSDAIAAYRQFVKSYPTHDMVANGYVAFRIGEAYGRSKCP